MISLKTTLKSFGVILICFCSIFLETLFLSYQKDIVALDSSLFLIPQKSFYDAQLSMCQMMNIISLGILGLFSFILLFFSIERYIDENKPNMGILKALGYKKETLAFSMMKYSAPTFFGCSLGYLMAMLFSKFFYETMNADKILPEFGFSFHFEILVLLTIVPALLVMLFSFFVGLIKLKGNPLDMINQKEKNNKSRTVKERDNFLKELRHTMIKNHLALIIFVAFATLCFSANVQMSFTLYHEAKTSALFFWMIFGIGLLLGITILILSFRFIYKANVKYMSMLKAYGYNQKECYYAMYGGYHLVAAISFLFGTFYQAILSCFMFKVFADIYGIHYSFDFLALLYAILIFVAVYASINLYYYKKINHLKVDSLNVDLG